MEISKNQFRKLVMLYSAVTIFYYICSFIVENQIADTEDLPTSVVVFGLSIIGLMIWTLVNMYSLYNFETFAPRHLFIISLAGLLIYLGDYFYSLSSTIVSAPITYNFIDTLSFIFYDIGLFLSGVILALTYYSNIYSDFKEPLLEVAPVIK